VISRRLLLGMLGAGALTLALYAAPAALAFSPEARTAKLDETLRELVDGRSTPGIAVLIIQNGRAVYSRSTGIREVGGTAPIGENDMFRLASMTKAVTSAAAMILVQEARSVLMIRSVAFSPSSRTFGCVGLTVLRLPRTGRLRSANC
jgi:CubicO group peptidase (beta-lactamase class C family)